MKSNIISEVERFGRIWTPECREVNPFGYGLILCIFLTTVDQEIRDEVHEAINKKYGD